MLTTPYPSLFASLPVIFLLSLVGCRCADHIPPLKTSMHFPLSPQGFLDPTSEEKKRWKRIEQRILNRHDERSLSHFSPLKETRPFTREEYTQALRILENAKTLGCYPTDIKSKQGSIDILCVNMSISREKATKIIEHIEAKKHFH